MIKRNKYIIIIAILLVLGVAGYFVYKNYTYEFYLIGDEKVTIDYAEEYYELGFVAKDGYGNDISDNVTINQNIDNRQAGTYVIKYDLNYRNIQKTITREVIVNEIKLANLEIVLNGDKEVFLLKDTEYQENGAYIKEKKSNTEYQVGGVEISGTVDSSKVGDYEISYTFIYKNESITEIRKVKVFDIGSDITPSNLTTGKVTIKLNLSDVNDYVGTKLPSGEILSSKEVDYEVDSNGEYEFTINTSSNQYSKKVTVDNIIGNYTCSGTITSTGTRIQVIPSSSEIKEYQWLINNGTVKGTNIFNKAKIIEKASVNLVFQNDKDYQINCLIKDELIYRFKYDANNTKPFMKCNTYTSQDKLVLDEKLKKAIAQAGYGTRAGVVEAARFLVGAMDYKVPYVGASKYNRAGLNIGQRNAWGCSGVGLDCYYFIDWIRSQNGLSLEANYAGKKYKIADEINNLKVGDYLLSPCAGNCKNIYGINHISIIIGIDSQNVYIAEGTTGNINAVVTTKIDKISLAKSTRVVRHVEYPKEGNVTNMWLS